MRVSEISDGPVRSVGIVTHRSGASSEIAQQAMQEVRAVASQLIARHTGLVLAPGRWPPAEPRAARPRLRRLYSSRHNTRFAALGLSNHSHRRSCATRLSRRELTPASASASAVELRQAENTALPSCVQGISHEVRDATMSHAARGVKASRDPATSMAPSAISSPWRTGVSPPCRSVMLAGTMVAAFKGSRRMGLASSRPHMNWWSFIACRGRYATAVMRDARRCASSTTTSSCAATTFRSPSRSTSSRGSHPYCSAACLTGYM